MKIENEENNLVLTINIFSLLLMLTIYVFITIITISFGFLWGYSLLTPYANIIAYEVWEFGLTICYIIIFCITFFIIYIIPYQVMHYTKNKNKKI